MLGYFKLVSLAQISFGLGETVQFQRRLEASNVQHVKALERFAFHLCDSYETVKMQEP